MTGGVSVEVPSDADVQARVVQIMAALEEAGATPIANTDLHAVAYLANVLSPMWDIEPIEGSTLKSSDGPYSYVFETHLDRCVCLGLIEVVSITANPDSHNRISASYRLDGKTARPVLEIINSFPDERIVRKFLDNLAYEFAIIEPDFRDETVLEDASWTDPSISDRRVVDFGDFISSSSNPSRNVINSFQKYAPEGVVYTRAEKLSMYLRFLKRRAHA